MTQPTQLTNEHLSRIRELHDRLVELGPDRFDMANWFTVAEDTNHLDTLNWDELMWRLEDSDEMLHQSDCGTAACIAGHAAILWSSELRPHTQSVDIARMLGMDVGVEPWQCERWFATSGWPEPWRSRWLAEMNSLPQLDYHDEDYVEQELANAFAKRAFEHRLVVEVMDDLIHGRRQHWYDGDTTAVDRADLVDAQLPADFEPF